jgi:hypothetical protein
MRARDLTRRETATPALLAAEILSCSSLDMLFGCPQNDQFSATIMIERLHFQRQFGVKDLLEGGDGLRFFVEGGEEIEQADHF